MIIENRVIEQTRNCVLCGRRTRLAKEYGYKNGISIVIPLCGSCEKHIGLCLPGSMDICLKGIAQSVRLSHIVTDDERRLQELQKKGIDV